MFIPAVGCPPATPSGQPTAGIRTARSQLLPGLAQSKSTKHRFKTKRSQPFLGNDSERQDFSSVRTGENTVRARARIQIDNVESQESKKRRVEYV